MNKEKQAFCDMINTGDTLRIPASLRWASGMSKRVGQVVLVVSKRDRPEEGCYPLITYATTDLKMDDIDLSCFYEEPPVVEMTLAEVCKKLGKNVKIVK